LTSFAIMRGVEVAIGVGVLVNRSSSLGVGVKGVPSASTGVPSAFIAGLVNIGVSSNGLKGVPSALLGQ
jgi:hypothetical protein